jgi:hypothetical protein
MNAIFGSLRFGVRKVRLHDVFLYRSFFLFCHVEKERLQSSCYISTQKLLPALNNWITQYAQDASGNR